MRPAILLGCLVLAACVSPAEDKPAASSKTAKAAPKKIEWAKAAEGPVAPLVAAELARAKQSGRRVLVYVGASWCEPCQRFHDAVQRGGLDASFGDLRFIEFDLDHDADRLREAGYAAKLIPLLALPLADGRASGKQMEGSIKGEGAVMQMAPRLTALLREAP